MTNRFIPFTLGISRLNKMVQKLKQEGMKSFSCKGVHTLCIYQLRENPGGMTSREIAASCDIDPGLVSRTLRELQKQGLVRKEGEDGKYLSQYYLSGKGKTVADEAIRKIEAVQHYVDTGISKEELVIFYRVFEKLTQNFEKLLTESGDILS